MSIYHRRFDPSLTPFYDAFLAGGEADRSLDGGCPVLRYSSVSLGTPRGVHDHQLQSCELFQNPVAVSSAYQQVFGASLPWSPPSAGLADDLLSRFDAMTASVSPSRELALAINRWVTAADGMNMVYDPHTVEQSAEEVMASPVRHGDCTEFTMVLLALLNRAGFQAYPIWVGRDLFGDEVQHFMVGVDVGGETLTFDPVYASFDPDYGVNPSHQTSLRAPMTTLLAWHWINRGNDLRDSHQFDAAEAAYRRAAMIDPANPHILLNQGVSRSGRAALALLSGDRTEARRWFQSAREDLSAALRLDPAFHQAYYAWGNLELDAGRSGVAVSYYRRAVSMAPNEPRYRCDLILALIRSDQRALARSELRYLEVHHSDFLADFLDQPDDDGRSTPRQRIEAALGSH